MYLTELQQEYLTYGWWYVQVAWRNTAGERSISHWWLSDTNQQVQFSRGAAAMFFMNIAADTFHGRLSDTQLPAGAYCNAYRAGCERVEILDDGSTASAVAVAPDSVLALHIGLMASPEPSARAGAA